MRDLGNNQFEITNKKTGAKKVVSGNDLPKYGLSKPTSNTSFGSKVQQGIYNIPIIGDIAEVVGASSQGLASAIKTPSLQKQTMADQEKARQLAIQARDESDPNKKKMMLDELRALSQGAGERASKYSESVDSMMPTWAKGKESPTTAGEKISAYGVPSARAGLAAGELAMLLFGVPKIGPEGNGFLKSLERIGAKTVAGSTLGGAQGFVTGDDKTLEERVESAEGGAKIGAILSFIGSAGGETINYLKSLNKTKAASSVVKKTGELVDKYGPKSNIIKKVDALASADPSVFNSDEAKELLKKEIMSKYTGKTQEALLKRLIAEPSGQTWTMEQIVNFKRNVPFNAMAKTSEKVFNNIKKRILSQLIHNANPTIGELDAIYSALSNKGVSKIIKRIAGWTAAGVGLKLGFGGGQR